MKMNQKLNEIYNSKLFWMIFSLLASVLLWAYITSIDSNEQSWTGESRWCSPEKTFWKTED